MKGVAVCAVMVVAVVLMVEVVPMAEGVTCNATELSPCLPAITGGSRPSPACCGKLKEQKPCLCGYLRNPSLKQYINGARKVATTCGVAIPNC